MLHIQPDFVDAWVRKGRALQHAGIYQEALASYKRALELDPAQKSIWQEIGEILEKLGKHEEAQICYAKAK
jgi:tetratricopeptide (TPR) repeat protein